MPLIVYDKIKPEKEGDAIMDAEDVDYNGKPITEYFAVALTQEEYDELLVNGKVVATTQYFIYEEDGK